MTHFKQYPVLVYGTLRPGAGNYETFLRGHTTSEKDIRIRGFNMYGSINDGFPYVMEGDQVITATLMNIKPEHYDFVMRGLDYLEGYRGVGDMNHYERKLATISSPDGEKIQAWVYIVEGEDARLISQNYPHTKLGDWLIQAGQKEHAY